MRDFVSGHDAARGRGFVSAAADSALFPADWVPVEVRFPEVAKQRRWTIALRALLYIPQAIVVIALDFAALLLVIVGWFSALVLGRLPVGIAQFLANVVRYQTRVSAYGWLLLDAYPPFAFERPYPVAVEIESGRLGRASVLFRWLLAIPARIIATCLAIGVSIAAIPIWLIVLVLGRMPQPLYEAGAAVIRYEARFTAYLLLLTDAYPRQLFGDRELVLTKVGKSIVALFLVLGLAALVAGGVLVDRAQGSSRIANQVVADYNALGAASTSFQGEVANCSGQKHALACTQAAIPGFIASLDRFHGQLRAFRFPTGAQADALRLEAAVAGMTRVFRRMAAAPTTTTFTADALSAADAGIEVDQRTRRLVSDLR
jgi:hypothetical protein